MKQPNGRNVIERLYRNGKGQATRARSYNDGVLTAWWMAVIQYMRRIIK
jgi:hypothetical protein